ncbi:hypothetical protein J7438_26120, partial [Thalassotalea sp. G20_0]|uniref:hypothetical protein n=1 Tax=Thalassotalea sp. G20_0 TaxID=2821093 RepID=UPI001ADC3CCC
MHEQRPVDRLALNVLVAPGLPTLSQARYGHKGLHLRLCGEAFATIHGSNALDQLPVDWLVLNRL